MKSAAFIALFLIGKAVCEDKPTYTTKYDNIDLDEILSSERLLTGYVNCLLDQGPCTPDGKELKHTLPDAIDNDCRKCTQKQKEGSDRVMGYIIEYRPNDWAKLEKKYLSDGSYKKKYLEKKNASENNGDSKSTEAKNKDDEEKKSKGDGEEK
ncbi:ejaculatory bulb-specific protein 3-like precursor [Plutella xylostella]|uniref:Chemosensory protein CSP1 n=1 Tax=Plutella xylostella TaxID=51655 RepID=A2IBC2_PLUXY|nr:ejaculatory bulb-specific protein 3-like precursor [Plutella xylostella]ABM67686.1 chemosensory protein CSP1 [Plutella xylostella]AEP25397.1 chemosensory protein CSP1 [Plutella xylostella]